MKKILLTVAVKLHKITACRKRGNAEVKSMDSKLFVTCGVPVCSWASYLSLWVQFPHLENGDNKIPIFLGCIYYHELV